MNRRPGGGVLTRPLPPTGQGAQAQISLINTCTGVGERGKARGMQNKRRLILLFGAPTCTICGQTTPPPKELGSAYFARSSPHTTTSKARAGAIALGSCFVLDTTGRNCGLCHVLCSVWVYNVSNLGADRTMGDARRRSSAEVSPPDCRRWMRGTRRHIWGGHQMSPKAI